MLKLLLDSAMPGGAGFPANPDNVPLNMIFLLAAIGLFAAGLITTIIILIRKTRTPSGGAERRDRK